MFGCFARLLICWNIDVPQIKRYAAIPINQVGFICILFLLRHTECSSFRLIGPQRKAYFVGMLFSQVESSAEKIRRGRVWSCRAIWLFDEFYIRSHSNWVSSVRSNHIAIILLWLWRVQNKMQKKNRTRNKANRYLAQIPVRVCLYTLFVEWLTQNPQAPCSALTVYEIPWIYDARKHS